MSSKDLLNQPLKDDVMQDDETSQVSPLDAALKDDNDGQLTGAQAISAFLNKDTKKPAETSKDNEESEEIKGLDADLRKAQAALRRTSLTPEERYKEILEDEEITLNEARQIIDRVVVQLEPWTESYKIAPSLSVTFQTRMPDDIQRLRDALEKMVPKFQATREFESAKYNLAASLVRYGEKTFSHGTEEDIRQMIKWIGRIPDPVFRQLQRKLYEFDRKISIVFSEGYLENF